MDAADTLDQIGETATNAADVNEALRDLDEANQAVDQLIADIASDGEYALDDLVHQINDLGDDCPAELRAARSEAEDAEADARQTLSDASESIATLSKTLKSLKAELS